MALLKLRMCGVSTDRQLSFEKETQTRIDFDYTEPFDTPHRKARRDAPMICVRVDVS